MSLDDLHVGASHQTDFVTASGTKFEFTESSKRNFLIVVLVVVILFGVTMSKLAREERDRQEHKER